jgi:hypothetical protein
LSDAPSNDVTNMDPVIDFARVCMLRSRVVVDLDGLAALDPVQRCMQVARVMNTVCTADLELRERYVGARLLDRLRDEAYKRQSAQALDIS